MTAATDPRDDLKRLEPYLGAIRQAAAERDVDCAILAALCLRETYAGWAVGYFPRGTHLGFGDGGNAFGLFQADYRTKQAQILSGDLLTVLGQARLAAGELAGNRRMLHATFPSLPAELLERGAVAAYNARLGAVALQLSRGKPVDAVTTKGPSGAPDYSTDVFRRAAALRARAPAAFPREVTP